MLGRLTWQLHIYRENINQPLFYSPSSFYSLRKRKFRSIYIVQRHPLPRAASLNSHSPECSTQLLKKFSFGEQCCSQPYMNKGGTLVMPKKSAAHVLVGTQVFILTVYLWFDQSFRCVSYLPKFSIIKLLKTTEYQTTLKQCYCYSQ